MDREEEKKFEQQLSQKVKLEDNTYNYVFVKLYDEDNKPSWRCNICDVTINGPLERHINGKKHQTGLTLPLHPPILWKKQNTKVNHTPRMMGDLRLAPGEPVPPGFEDEVNTVTEIQASLDAYHSGPLIGLEYLVELIGYEDEREPQYICLLCDKRGDPRTVMAHLVSFNHRMTYLNVHFPTVYRLVSPYNTKQYRRNVQACVQTICEHIEKKFGRMTPQAAEKDRFEKKKAEYAQNAHKAPHPSEKSGETFEHLVDRDTIISIPKDPLQEIKKANEEIQNKGKPNRKRDPSPPVVAAPAIRYKSSKTDRRSLSSISSISSSSLDSAGSRSRSRSKNRGRRRYPSHRSPSSRSRGDRPYRERRSRSYSRSPHRDRGGRYPPGRGPPHKGGPLYDKDRRPLPWQRPDYGKKDYYDRHERSYNRKAETAKAERYEEYRRLCILAEEEMDRILSEHEKNPEKHPMYPEEWKKFWNRRYKELQSEGKDPAKHDFKPEWIDFWNRRMKEMHEDELRARKDQIRKRLNIPEDPTPISFKIKSKSNSRSIEKEMPHQKKLIEVPSTSDDVIIIDDSKDESPLRRRDSRERSIPHRDRERNIRERKRSHSPWEREPSIDRDRDRRDYRDYRDMRDSRDRRDNWYKPKPYRDVPHSREDPDYKKKMYRKSVTPPPYPDHAESTDINIVAILRLLTALEEKLGSLGPRVIELLAQALALEKNEANSSETLLDNDVNCVFFETVKEKLKGQLLAGMVEPSAERTFKNAIQKIASLLHFASERKKENEKKLKVKSSEPVQIPGIGKIDKAAIAKQIATSLIMQGKTDVTQAELEQLINAVVGMAQASQNSGGPISTASFLQQLTATPVEPQVPKEEPVKPKEEPEQKISSTLQMLQNDPPSPVVQNPMEGLSDSDLKTLLQNFKDLSTDEQHSLITYLKKLEAREPERVERLRKFVKLGPSENEKAITGRSSPFSNREGGQNPMGEEKSNKTIAIDSDDEDYSYEDVFRAASKNVSEKQAQETDTKKDSGVNINDTKAIIANLMGQLGSKNSPLNLLGLGGSPAMNTSTTNPNLPKSQISPNLPTDVVNLVNQIPPSLLNNLKPIPNPETQNFSQSNYPVQNYQPYSNFNNQNPNPQHFNNQFNNNPNNRTFNNDPYGNYDGYNNFQNHSSMGAHPQGPGSMTPMGHQGGHRPPFNHNRGPYPPYDARQNYY